MPATGGASAMLGVGRNDLRDAQGPWAGQYGTGDAIVTIDFALGLSSSLPACSY